MPLGPTDSPGLYTAMMMNFKYEWDMLFIETLSRIGTLTKKQVTVTETETDEVFIEDKRII